MSESDALLAAHYVYLYMFCGIPAYALPVAYFDISISVTCFCACANEGVQL